MFMWFSNFISLTLSHNQLLTINENPCRMALILLAFTGNKYYVSDSAKIKEYKMKILCWSFDHLPLKFLIGSLHLILRCIVSQVQQDTSSS